MKAGRLMKHAYACGSAEHNLSRREVMQMLVGSVAGIGGHGLLSPAIAQQIKSQQKRVLFVWLDGAISQFESWDPKPGTQFGGPFQAIQTPLPGVHVSELMPNMATHLDRFSLIRSMHTRFEDHSRAVQPIQRGDPKNRGVTYPLLGSALSKLIGPGESDLPPYVHIKPGSGGFHYKDAGFLGAQHGALALGDGKPPANMTPLVSISSQFDKQRHQLREAFNQRFSRRRTTLLSNAYDHSYVIARQLMRNAHLFDPARLEEKDIQRYGNSEFGRHMLQARRLLEAGVMFVKVTMYHWDTHGDNFNCHLDGIPKVDKALATMIDDLIDRGLYDSTLVVVLSEFGRTPKVNGRVGRDHWPECWSLGVGGCGIQPGVIVGQTNPKGTFNVGKEYDIGDLYHTLFRALGIDPVTTQYHNNGQPLPIAHDDCEAIEELLV